MRAESRLRSFVFYGVFVIVIGIAALLLLTERRGGWMGLLPYLLLLACPLMHIILHRHHGQRSRRQQPRDLPPQG